QKQPAEVKEYAEWLVRGIYEHLAEVDQKIQEASRNWRLERMANVDRNVLRLAVFEMLFEKNLAPPIIINEAIEIAKKYSGQEAGVFVNGILDGVYKRLYKPVELGTEVLAEKKEENKMDNKSEEEVKNE
ncbi:MAG: transcription antitermination factor NusB, partial [Candidatus Aminicenantes bacterium]|nr:transcription antitermination factor NusB [Candidatus Aminicenantes bacterium]